MTVKVLRYKDNHFIGNISYLILFIYLNVSSSKPKVPETNTRNYDQY